jgi:aromatic-L-amino-acid decarboxylase
MHGAAVFRAALDEKLDLARHLAAGLREIPGIEIVAEPELSLLAFRARPAGLDGAALDAYNRKFVQRVNARQRVLLTGVVLCGAPSVGDRFVVRACVLSFRTHRDRVDACLEDIRASLDDLSRT